MLDRPIVLLVDAFSTGRLLAEQWYKTHNILHVTSRRNMPQAFINSAPTHLFSVNLVFNGQLDDLVEDLSAYNISHLNCGSEFGVELADQLADRLGFPGNPISTVHARRNKYEMARLLKERNVPVPLSHHASSVADAIMAYQSGLPEKVVVKPQNSAGSEDVYICTTQTQVEEASNAILGKINLMQEENRGVIIQEFLEGAEFVINSVSVEGLHQVTDLWECRKKLSANGRMLYDYEVLQDSQSDRTRTIMAYVYSILDGLDIRWGAAHTELILTENGPRLLETGARISGLANINALNSATGNNQIDQLINTTQQSQSFECSEMQPYHRHRNCYCVNLISSGTGQFNFDGFNAALKRLPSFESLRRRTSTPDVKETVDLNSSPGVVFLVHESQSQIDADYQAIRELEAEHFRPKQTCLATED